MLFTVDDCLGAVLWTKLFLEAQGYKSKDTIIYRDNESAILLEKNGRRSNSQCTKHINIQYFFVTDRIANGEIKIEYCPTNDMIADYFSKLLQGTQFVKLGDEIVGGQQ